jgi:hypothetical protein
MPSPMFDIYTFDELAQHWAQEAKQPVGVVRRELARALLAEELKPRFSAASVVVHRDDVNKSLSIYLDEDLVNINVPGSTRQSLNKLPERILHQWMNNIVEVIAAGAEQGISSGTNLILIARDDFREWLERKNYPLPEFWFSETLGGKDKDGLTRNWHQKSASAQLRTSKRQKSAEIKNLVRIRALELRRDNPNWSWRLIAQRLEMDDKLNPTVGGKRHWTAETFRKYLYKLR